MITDAQTMLSGAHTAAGTITPQTVTAAAVSDNTIDLVKARDMGEGTDLYGRFQVETAAAGGTTMEFQIIAADDAALSSNIVVVGSTGAMPVASLKAGARFACKLSPQISSTGKRYLGARYVPTGTFTAGKYFADVGLEISDQKAYPVGYSVI